MQSAQVRIEKRTRFYAKWRLVDVVLFLLVDYLLRQQLEQLQSEGFRLKKA